VKGIISKQYDGDGKGNEDFSVLKVNINDKVQKIADIHAVDDIGGFYMFQGKYLEGKDLDETFVKLFIKD
jgi:hypothetical protein|tara:strand:- start:328 stop:537 length:210 start_codon:yes stop_codon:yes gene_type:complete